MKQNCVSVASLMFLGLLALPMQGGEPPNAAASHAAHEPKPIQPARSIGTGLLLEPPLDLSWFTREKFIAEVSTVGAEKLNKRWTSPVFQLPPHACTASHEKDGIRAPLY
ncbi:MAG: hypothetical protein SGJ19_18090 [Planctomycetia bacterium]|nr:hypothetical protein [Planctomycetia bacterium]